MKNLNECFEIDGSQMAFFDDGTNDKQPYIMLALGCKYPATLQHLLRAFNTNLNIIKDRSEAIIWRIRPKVVYLIEGGYPSNCPPDGWEKKYKDRKASITVRCRLACYPPLSEEELPEIPRKEEGGPVPAL